MSDKVTPLPFVSPQQALGAPDERLVRNLEQLLARAKSGELQQLVAGGLDHAGNPVTLMAVTGKDHWAMHGVLAYLLQQHGERLK